MKRTKTFEEYQLNESVDEFSAESALTAEANKTLKTKLEKLKIGTFYVKGIDLFLKGKKSDKRLLSIKGRDNLNVIINKVKKLVDNKSDTLIIGDDYGTNYAVLDKNDKLKFSGSRADFIKYAKELGIKDDGISLMRLADHDGEAIMK